jgi:hypothetical protein
MFLHLKPKIIEFVSLNCFEEYILRLATRGCMHLFDCSKMTEKIVSSNLFWLSMFKLALLWQER